jgi:ABC-type nickel/cobalt efflux system permease component RcnA
MRRFRKTITLLQLLALAYLGFYVWGVAMSVFTPMEMGVMSTLSVVFVVAIIVSAVATRRAGVDQELERKTYRLRERRGF